MSCVYCKSDADGRLCASCEGRFTEIVAPVAAIVAPRARVCGCYGDYPACPGPMECGNTDIDWDAP